MKRPWQRWTTTPLWVQLVYEAVQWFEYQTTGAISRMTYWRFKFLDDHCSCDHCEKRRAEGHQGPKRRFI